MGYYFNNVIRICEMYLMDAPKIRFKKSIILRNMSMKRILQLNRNFQETLHLEENELLLRDIQKLIQKLRKSQKNDLILRNIQKLIQKLRKSQKKMIMN